MKKRCFLILQGSELTHARWSETFWYAEIRYSFLVNLMQKLSKSVNICKSCCLQNVYCHVIYAPQCSLLLLIQQKFWTESAVVLHGPDCRQWLMPLWMTGKYDQGSQHSKWNSTQLHSAITPASLLIFNEDEEKTRSPASAGIANRPLVHE